MNASMTPYQQAEKEKEYQTEWDASSDIRAEFGGDGNFEIYKAYRESQDKGRLPSDRVRRRFTLRQLQQHVQLSWDCSHDLRQRFANFEAYRSRRFFDEILGSYK
jgi:hypothetical protein